MGQEDILNVFFEHPGKDFHIRGIAKDLCIPKTTVSFHIHKLLQKKLIVRNQEGIFPSFRANSANEFYRFSKRQYILKNLISSGLLDYLEEEFHPKCIVLFGSFSKAEYDLNSDIDLFVQALEAKICLGEYEKKLEHKINVLFEPNLAVLSRELLNNIINGIKLRGFLKIK